MYFYSRPPCQAKNVSYGDVLKLNPDKNLPNETFKGHTNQVSRKSPHTSATSVLASVPSAQEPLPLEASRPGIHQQHTLCGRVTFFHPLYLFFVNISRSGSH